MPCNRAQSTIQLSLIDGLVGFLKFTMNTHFTQDLATFLTVMSPECHVTKENLKLARQGTKTPSKLGVSNEKQMFITLACCFTQGDFMPLHTIYKGVHLMSSWTQGGSVGSSYDVSPSGWMESEQFCNKTYFVERCKKLDGQKLLFLDGHASHITMKLIDLAIENNITLYKLAAHISHILQPAAPRFCRFLYQ